MGAAPRASIRAHPRSRGENVFHGCAVFSMEAHPRSRGENPRYSRVMGAPQGSSPLTRGKRLFVARLAIPDRLIPAHAGKTCLVTRAGQSTGAHPRSRGENASALARAFASRGSSPLTRGKLMLTLSTSVGARLIPAHAGKTRASAARAPTRAAHPRSRGENTWSRRAVW